jgi:hypothetical protein
MRDYYRNDPATLVISQDAHLDLELEGRQILSVRRALDF